MSRTLIIPSGGNTKQGKQPRSAAYDDPQVARTITRLRQKLANLEDLQSGSLMRNDVYKYLIKPKFGQALQAGNTMLTALHGPAKQVGNRTVGSPQYTWFLNAVAGRVCDQFILTAANIIFGPTSREFGAKVIAGANNYRGADGVPGYLKRRYSQTINRYWVYHRLGTIGELFPKLSVQTIMTEPGAQEDYNTALAAFRAGHSVGQQRGGRRGTPSFNAATLAARMNQGGDGGIAEDIFDNASISSSSSSGSVPLQQN